MDSYDEKAQAMIGHYPPSLPTPCPEECRRCERVAFTAHAMREAAAEAFREAAAYYEWSQREPLANRIDLAMRARAAALAPQGKVAAPPDAGKP